MSPLFIGGLGLQEIILLLVIVLLFFGGRKIPEMMKGLGQGVRSFKDGMNSVVDVEEKKVEASTKKKESNEPQGEGASEEETK